MQDYKKEMKHLKKDIKARFVTKVYFDKFNELTTTCSDDYVF
jgi:hypothetical protein